MTKFKISKNIPIPAKTPGARPVFQYPFDQMDVGDSFELNNFHPVRTPSRLRYHADKQGVKVAYRTVGKNKARVWRVMAA